MSDTAGALTAFALESGICPVCKSSCCGKKASRFVPEKRHLDLIAAFQRAALPRWKLAIVGASDHPHDYVKDVLGEAAATPGVVGTGLQTGLALRELYARAGVFLPSPHEGLPIATVLRVACDRQRYTGQPGGGAAQ